MKRTKIMAWGITTICMALMQLAGCADSSQPSDLDAMAGEWARIDGSYILRIENVMGDGTADVSYFNPKKIHVAESQISKQNERIRLFVKLQDEGYPGCTYTLFYYPEHDVLAGVYYQAAVQQSYEVVFVRKEAG